jgi:hypothetical protein
LYKQPQHRHLPRFESRVLFPDSVRSAYLLERWHCHPDEEAAKAAEQAAPDRISQVSMSLNWLHLLLTEIKNKLDRLP